MIKKGFRLRPDFRVTIGGEELKRAQGISFGDETRSERHASYHSQNFNAPYCFGRDGVVSFVSCDMSGSCSDAEKYFYVFTSHASSFFASSLDIFREFGRKIIGQSHLFFFLRHKQDED